MDRKIPGVRSWKHTAALAGVGATLSAATLGGIAVLGSKEFGFKEKYAVTFDHGNSDGGRTLRTVFEVDIFALLMTMSAFQFAGFLMFLFRTVLTENDFFDDNRFIRDLMRKMHGLFNLVVNVTTAILPMVLVGVENVWIYLFAVAGCILPDVDMYLLPDISDKYMVVFDGTFGLLYWLPLLFHFFYAIPTGLRFCLVAVPLIWHALNVMIITPLYMARRNVGGLDNKRKFGPLYFVNYGDFSNSLMFNIHWRQIVMIGLTLTGLYATNGYDPKAIGTIVTSSVGLAVLIFYNVYYVMFAKQSDADLYRKEPTIEKSFA